MPSELYGHTGKRHISRTPPGSRPVCGTSGHVNVVTPWERGQWRFCEVREFGTGHKDKTLRAGISGFKL